MLVVSKCTAELTSCVCRPSQRQKVDENTTEYISHAVSDSKRVKDVDREPGRMSP